MHFCADELMVLMLAIGSIPMCGPWLRQKISKLCKPHCCDKSHEKK